VSSGNTSTNTGSEEGLLSMTNDITTPLAGLSEVEAASLADELQPMLKSADDQKWGIGDLLNRRLAGRPEGQSHSDFKVLARVLSERGQDVAESTLSTYHRTARAFPEAARKPGIAWTTHRVIADAGAPEFASTRMEAFVSGARANGMSTSSRNAAAFFGQPVRAQVGEPGALDYLNRHPEVISKAIKNIPGAADAARSGLGLPSRRAEDDVPNRHPLPATPSVDLPNPSMGLIAEMERNLRGLRSAIPFVRSDDDRHEAVNRMQALIAGLEECIARADIGWAAAQLAAEVAADEAIGDRR